jgi:rhodanese-related sulfurtransferase
VPGSLSIEEGDATLAYVGWLLPFNAALVLVTEDAVQADRMTVDLRRIGYEEVRGYLPFAGWRAAGHPVARLDVVDRATAARTLAAGDTPVYDVRFDSDARTLALPGAERRPIDRVREWLPAVADDELLVTCAGGSRATTVASLLEAAGRHPRVLIDGGAEDLVPARRAPQGRAEGTSPPTVGAPLRSLRRATEGSGSGAGAPSTRTPSTPSRSRGRCCCCRSTNRGTRSPSRAAPATTPRPRRRR